MSFKINPVLWPVLFLGSPVIIPMLMKKNKLHEQNKVLVKSTNKQRIDQTQKIKLPELDFVQLKVIVEYTAKEGCKRDPGAMSLS